MKHKTPNQKQEVSLFTYSIGGICNKRKPDEKYKKGRKHDPK